MRRRYVGLWIFISFAVGIISFCSYGVYTIGQTCGFDPAPKPIPHLSVTPTTEQITASAITTRITYAYTVTQPLDTVQHHYHEEMLQYCQQEDTWQFAPAETCTGQRCLEAGCYLKGWIPPNTPIQDVDVTRNTQRFSVALSETISGQTTVFQQEIRSDHC
jgi:hypothetical protein